MSAAETGGAVVRVGSRLVAVECGGSARLFGDEKPTTAWARVECEHCDRGHEIEAPLDCLQRWGTSSRLSIRDDDNGVSFEAWYRSRHALACDGCGAPLSAELRYRWVRRNSVDDLADRSLAQALLGVSALHLDECSAAGVRLLAPDRVYELRYEWEDVWKTYELPSGETLIGRAADCSIVLSDFGVSRHHAKVVVHEDRAWLIDLHSKCGVELNGLPVSEAPLRDGDEFLVWKVAFFFRMQGRHSTMCRTHLAKTGWKPATIEPPPRRPASPRQPASLNEPLETVARRLQKKLVDAIQDNSPQAEAAWEQREAERDARMAAAVERLRKQGKLPPSRLD